METNDVACQVAHTLFKTPTKICRIYVQSAYAKLPRAYLAINPTYGRSNSPEEKRWRNTWGSIDSLPRRFAGMSLLKQSTTRRL